LKGEFITMLDLTKVYRNALIPYFTNSVMDDY